MSEYARRRERAIWTIGKGSRRFWRVEARARGLLRLLATESGKPESMGKYL